jgi:hypothetical protein
MRQSRKRLCGCRTCFWNLASRAAFISYNTCGGSEWLRNIKAPKTIRQQLTTMNRRLTTIVKPPSIMRVELMKRRGIMPTWPMATLAMHGIMQRKLVNITLRNTARKNSRLRQLRVRPWRRQVDGYCNSKRLHSAPGYITPNWRAAPSRLVCAN